MLLNGQEISALMNKMKRLLLAPLLLSLLSPVQAEDNPFETKPRYGHDPYNRGSLIKKKTRTESENKALEALCKIGLNADDGIWSNEDINAAIASISWGRHWPDTASGTAYKTCNYGGYLK